MVKRNMINKNINTKAQNTNTQNTKPHSQTPLQNPVLVCALAVLCNALWGSAFPAVKSGYRLFEIPGDSPASQILFAGARFFLAGILAVLFGSILQRKLLLPKKSSVPLVLKLSVFQTILQYIFFYLGLAHTSGVKGSIIIASNTFVTILVTSLIFRQEKLTGRKIAACAIGFAGVVLVNLNGSGFSMSARFDGEGFLLISVAAYAFASSLLKIYSQKEDPVVLSGYQFMAGGMVMILGGLLLGGRMSHISLKGIVMLVYLALISSVAFSLWGILLKYNPVSKIAVYGFTNPVFGVLLSVFILHEKNQAKGWQIAVALALVCAGIYLVNKAPGNTDRKLRPLRPENQKR